MKTNSERIYSDYINPQIIYNIFFSRIKWKWKSNTIKYLDTSFWFVDRIFFVTTGLISTYVQYPIKVKFYSEINRRQNTTQMSTHQLFPFLQCTEQPGLWVWFQNCSLEWMMDRWTLKTDSPVSDLLWYCLFRFQILIPDQGHVAAGSLGCWMERRQCWEHSRCLGLVGPVS